MEKSKSIVKSIVSKEKSRNSLKGGGVTSVQDYLMGKTDLQSLMFSTRDELMKRTKEDDALSDTSPDDD